MSDHHYSIYVQSLDDNSSNYGGPAKWLDDAETFKQAESLMITARIEFPEDALYCETTNGERFVLAADNTLERLTSPSFTR